VAEGEADEEVVEVEVALVVAVAEPVTSGKSPLPHPELGSIVNVKATIVRRGRKRAALTTAPPLGLGPPPAAGLIGAVRGLIL